MTPPDSADPRARWWSRRATHDPESAWRLARERERRGPAPAVRAWLDEATATDEAGLRAWLEGLVPHGQAWAIAALSAAVAGCWEELGETTWAPEDAAAAAWACAFDPAPARRDHARALADEADAVAARGHDDVALVAAAAARLARLAADHDPAGSPKRLLQQAGLVVRALLASGTGPAGILAHARERVG